MAILRISFPNQPFFLFLFLFLFLDGLCAEPQPEFPQNMYSKASMRVFTEEGVMKFSGENYISTFHNLVRINWDITLPGQETGSPLLFVLDGNKSKQFNIDSSVSCTEQDYNKPLFNKDWNANSRYLGVIWYGSRLCNAWERTFPYFGRQQESIFYADAFTNTPVAFVNDEYILEYSDVDPRPLDQSLFRLPIDCKPVTQQELVDLPNKYTNPLGSFSLSWELIGDSIEVEFSMVGSSYIALGLGGSVMKGSDIIVGWVNDDGTFEITDRWAEGHSKPKLDTDLGGSDDLTKVAGIFQDGRTTLRFRRLLNTGDKYDYSINPNETLKIIYAWSNGKAGDLHFHGDNRNYAYIDLTKKDGIYEKFREEEIGFTARQLLNNASYGFLTTLHASLGGLENINGWPYSAVADFADEEPSTGKPLLLLSTTERSIMNIKADKLKRVSLSIQIPEEGVDPMMVPRMTVMGRLTNVTETEVESAKKAFLSRHPDAAMWIDFKDFSLYRIEIEQVYWVGGFGHLHYIGWIDKQRYLSHKL